MSFLKAILGHLLDLIPASGSTAGSLNVVETIKLVANFVAVNAAAWTFLGPKAAVVAGLATLVLKAIQLLTNEDPNAVVK